MYFSPTQEKNDKEQTEEVVEEVITNTLVTDGNYNLIVSESKLNWAGRKPLVEGYINSGTFDITKGAIEVEDAESTGIFEIDINTLSVSETKAKPGAETALEGHLKGGGWFNVEEFPTATFTINTVTPRIDTETTFVYDVIGTLVMKGETGELTFPANIFLDDEGKLIVEAELDFDRTKWGLTAGSGLFFDNLADQIIDDLVKLSFRLVAEKEGEIAVETETEDSEEVVEEDVSEETPEEDIEE